MPTALAFRYAHALAGLAAKSGIEAQAISGELSVFQQMLAASAGLRVALESPAVPPARKRAVVERLAQALPLSDLVRRFVLVLTDHRRTPLLPEIHEALESVVDERLGVVRAEVASARPLEEGQQRDILGGLARLTGRETRARFAVREELIGGVVARIGSTVYDGSVRGQLEALKRRLAGTES